MTIINNTYPITLFVYFKQNDSRPKIKITMSYVFPNGLGSFLDIFFAVSYNIFKRQTVRRYTSLSTLIIGETIIAHFGY